MKYGVISGGKKIRSTIIFDTGKLFKIKEKKLLVFVQQLNVFILTLLFMTIFLVWIMIYEKRKTHNT